MHRSFTLADAAAAQIYDIMATLIVPRPIAFVSTLSSDGVANLAPFSYFMPGGVNPPSLCFCTILGRDGHKKDSLRNIEETGEFVVNLVMREMAEGMNETGFGFPPHVSEWPASGFTPIESDFVKPARVQESPAHFECRLFQAVQHGEGQNAGVYVMGEILAAHVSESLFSGEQVLPFEPIARLGGSSYFDLACGKVFEMSRPKGSQ